MRYFAQDKVRVGPQRSRTKPPVRATFLIQAKLLTVPRINCSTQLRLFARLAFVRFKGKGVAVTGAARGIGRNIARAFGREGARVAICDMDAEKARKTVADLVAQDIQAEFVHVDLSGRGAPQAMVRQVADRWGRVDALINNARSGRRTEPLRVDEADWDETLSVTLRAAFFATQEAMRLMKTTEGGGSIVNISSTTALVTACDVSPTYQIAKAGMIQMTRYFAAE